MIKMISNNILPITIHDCIIVPKDTLFDYESYMYSLLIKECFYYKYFISNLYQKERNKKDKSIALLFILFKYVFIKNTISFLVRKFDYG